MQVLLDAPPSPSDQLADGKTLGRAHSTWLIILLTLILIVSFIFILILFLKFILNPHPDIAGMLKCVLGWCLPITYQKLESPSPDGPVSFSLSIAGVNIKTQMVQ